MSSWLVYVGVGKLLIYLGMQFPLPQFLKEKKTIEYLHSCDLCMGVWIYLILAFFMHKDLLTIMGFEYVPFLSELVTGGSISFLMHVFSIGWREKFTPDIHME